jgi:ribonucleoside-diphosphate reductase alpha chain
VQEELVLGGQMRVAERYIVYRAERAALRAQDVGTGDERRRTHDMNTAWRSALTAPMAS